MKWVNWMLALLWVPVFVFLIVQPEFIMSRLDERSHREFFEKAAKELNISVKSVERPRRILRGVEKPQMAEMLKKVREYRQAKNETIRFVLFGFISSLIGLGFVLNRAYYLKRKHHMALTQKHQLISKQHNQLQQVVEELQRSKNQIRESEQFLREVMDSAYDATLLFAVDGKVIDVSRKTANLFRGSNEVDFESFAFTDFIPDEEEEERGEQCFEKVLNGEVVFFESEINRPDGSAFDAEVYMKKIEHAGEKVVLANIRDVSERKQMEEDLRTSKLQLEEANGAKDKLFSIIAHDLKNPFHSIMAFSEVLVKFGDRYSLEKIRKFHNNIYHTSRQTYSLLENLLDWSRSQMGRIQCFPRSVNLKDTVEEIVLLYADQAVKKEIKVENHVDAHHLAYVDPNMLRSVLRNLLGNAIKYTDKGKIRLDSSLSHGMLKLKVRDTGVGMSTEQISRLFHLKEQVSTHGTRNEPGTGLGLLLCRELAQKNGGEISVNSSLGKGSEFVLTMPLSDQPELKPRKDNEALYPTLSVQKSRFVG